MDMMRLFETLRTQGYEGGYDAVRRHARRWRRAEAGQAATAFVPLSFDPGEAYQFDWSHEVVVLAGVTATVKVAHVRLCHSRMFFVAAYAPLGYDPHDRTLVINQAEAVIVRTSFRRYLDLGSVYALHEDLEREGFRSTVTMSRNGNTRGGQPFSRGSLFHMLRNRLYLGEIVHRDVTHPGLHPAVVDRDLFDQVQSMLERRRGHHRKRQASRAPLVGILVDALGNRIAATHSRGRGDRRYLYYISPVPASHPDASRVLRRVPATGIEEIMIERLRAWSGRRSAGWSDLVPFLKRVELHPEAVVVDLLPPAHENWTGDPRERWTRDESGMLRITSPVKVRTRGGRTSRIDGSARPVKTCPDRALIAGLRRAHLELTGRGIDMAQANALIDDARGVEDPYLQKLTRIAFLAPDIQRSILEGRQPPGLKLADLLARDLPL